MTEYKTFAEEVEARSGQKLNLCYQCLKCFVGCPMCNYMDYKPNTIIRMIQYGEKEKLLSTIKERLTRAECPSVFPCRNLFYFLA